MTGTPKGSTESGFMEKPGEGLWLCVYFMMGTPEGSTESSFMEKQGIKPATPGLQGIARIHYTTGASSHAYSHLISQTVISNLCHCILSVNEKLPVSKF